jgi:predicted small lipoprotein YifL
MRGLITGAIVVAAFAAVVASWTACGDGGPDVDPDTGADADADGDADGDADADADADVPDVCEVCEPSGDAGLSLKFVSPAGSATVLAEIRETLVAVPYQLAPSLARLVAVHVAR